MCPRCLDLNSMPFVIPGLLTNPKSVLCPCVGPGDCCGILFLRDVSGETTESCVCFYHRASFHLSSRSTPIIQVQAPTSNLPRLTDTETATDAEDLSSILLLRSNPHCCFRSPPRNTAGEKGHLCLCLIPRLKPEVTAPR